MDSYRIVLPNNTATKTPLLPHCCYVPSMSCTLSRINLPVALFNSGSWYYNLILVIILLISECSSWRSNHDTWWRHQMETFSALLAICAGNSPVHGEFPTQRPVTRSFDVFFDLRLNKWLSKQSWGWWFETLPHPLWRHSNVYCHMTRNVKNCDLIGPDHYFHKSSSALHVLVYDY